MLKVTRIILAIALCVFAATSYNMLVKTEHELAARARV